MLIQLFCESSGYAKATIEIEWERASADWISKKKGVKLNNYTCLTRSRVQLNMLLTDLDYKKCSNFGL